MHVGTIMNWLPVCLFRGFSGMFEMRVASENRNHVLYI